MQTLQLSRPHQWPRAQGGLSCEDSRLFGACIKIDHIDPVCSILGTGVELSDEFHSALEVAVGCENSNILHAVLSDVTTLILGLVSGNALCRPSRTAALKQPPSQRREEAQALLLVEA